jgi:hypothetical protein
MADLDLDAIRDREAAATPGHWYTGPAPDDQRRQARIQICDAGWDFDLPDGHHALVHAPKPAEGWPSTGDVAAADADAEFIAHARQDVPALLAEVVRLRALLSGGAP